MTATISGIKRMEIHDGDGIRTTVFFKGCPLKCIWCHNPECISFERQIARFSHKCIGCGECKGEVNEKTAAVCPVAAQIEYGKEYSAEELCRILKKDKPFFDKSGGGVTLSGGECLARPELAVSLARMLKEEGIGVYVDTCGYAPQRVFDEIIPYTDVFLYDLKAVDGEVHRRCTGRDNGIILENLKHLSSKGCEIEIRYPLVMGYNDGECPKIGELLRDLKGIRRVKVLRYHSMAASRYAALGMENTLPDTVTSPEDVRRAVDILRSFGLNATHDE